MPHARASTSNTSTARASLTLGGTRTPRARSEALTRAWNESPTSSGYGAMRMGGSGNPSLPQPSVMRAATVERMGLPAYARATVRGCTLDSTASFRAWCAVSLLSWVTLSLLIEL